MRSLWKCSVALLMTLTLISPAFVCASEKQSEEKIKVATVNGAPIYKKDFDLARSHFENQLKRNGHKLDPEKQKEIKSKALESLIDSEVLYQASQKSNLTIDEKIFNDQWAKYKERKENDKKFRANIEKLNVSDDEVKYQIRRQMFIQKFLYDTIIEKTSVDKAEMKAYYDGNPQSFKRPEQVQASHILIKVDPKADEAQKTAALDKIKDIKQKIENGEDFAVLAKKYSQCPSSKKGGDLGFFGRGQMVKPFEEAAFKMEIGQVSDIVQTTFGYHLIKLMGKRAASTTSFEESQKQIEGFLKKQKARQAIAKFVADEKGKAKIERFLK